MVEWHGGRVQTGAVELSYERAGPRGAPVVVLAHGITDSGRCWVAVADWLAGRYDVVRYDARGHGLSESAATFSADAHADDLLALVDRLALPAPAVLGHSMGATTATVAAARAPTRFRALLLEDPPFFDKINPASAEQRPQWAAQERASLEQRRARSIGELVAQGRADSPHWSEAEHRASAEAKRQMRPEIADFYAHPFPDWRALLARIPCPILLITGDPAAEALVTPELALEAEGIAPELVAVQLPGAGHSIRRDRPADYMAAVERFLDVV